MDIEVVAGDTADARKSKYIIRDLPRDVNVEECSEVFNSIEQCQEALCQHSLEVYSAWYPDLTLEDWWCALSCGRLKEVLAAGVFILRAEELCSGTTIGYISACRRFEGAGFHINHLVVLPEHRGQGVGRSLLDALIRRFQRSAAGLSCEVRLGTTELNGHVTDWYKRYGFSVDRLYVQHLGKTQRCPVVYFEMALRSCTGATICDTARVFFGDEICGESVRCFNSAKHDAVGVGERSCPAVETVVMSYEPEQASTEGKLHLLQNGRRLNMTSAFVEGRVQFARPLHEALRGSSYVSEWPSNAGFSQWKKPVAANPKSSAKTKSSAAPTQKRVALGAKPALRRSERIAVRSKTVRSSLRSLTGS